MTLCI